MEVATIDVDGFVRRKAEVCANSIKDWIADWAKKPLLIDLKKINEEKIKI